MLALGADFVLLGRGFLYAVAALGEAGADHAIAILTEEMQNAMLQLGAERLDQLADRLAIGWLGDRSWDSFDKDWF